MKPKSYLIIFLGGLLFAITFLGYAYFSKTPQFAHFYNWSQQNVVWFVAITLFLKTLGIVYPPLPSVVFTLGAIPILGWFPAYLIDLTGTFVAGTIDYVLGKKYGYSLLYRLFDKEAVEKIKSVKVKPNREIESVFVMRALLSGIILEAVYYGAGLLGIRYVNFLIGAVLSHLALGIPTFLVGEAIFKSQNMIVASAIVVATLLLAYKLKGRYFE